MTATATAMPDWMHSCCARNAGGAVGDGGGCVVAVAARLCASGARSPCALSVPGGWVGMGGLMGGLRTTSYRIYIRAVVACNAVEYPV